MPPATRPWTVPPSATNPHRSLLQLSRYRFLESPGMTPTSPTNRSLRTRRGGSLCLRAARVPVQIQLDQIDHLKLLEDEQLLDELHAGVVPDNNNERLPVLLASSDNNPQMTSKATAVS